MSSLCRYNLVPKKLKEDVFWRNYFYRVTLITQSAHLKCMGDQGNKAAATTQEQHAHAKENQKAKDSQDTSESLKLICNKSLICNLIHFTLTFLHEPF